MSLKSDSYYSNYNVYGNNGQKRCIMNQVPTSEFPSIFYHVKPHALPEIMRPKHINTPYCSPYALNYKNNC